MKSVDISSISPSAAIYFKNGVLEHYNLAIKETGKYLGYALIGDSYTNAGTCYILWGLNNSGSGLNYIISEGVIFLGGELYHVPAQSITVSGGQSPQIQQVTSYTSGANADPFDFTDGSSHNILIDRTANFIAATTTGNYLEYANLIRVAPYTVSLLTLTGNYTSASAGIRKNKDGLLNFTGGAQCGAGAAAGQTITTLPIGYRPPSSKIVSAFLYDTVSANYKTIALTINTSGTVVLTSANGATLNTAIIYLDSIAPFYNS